MMPHPQAIGSHIGTGGLGPVAHPHIAMHMPSLLPRRDGGGSVAPTPGMQPNNANANPMLQGYIQRFAQMPPEQLQELVARLGTSPMGYLAQRVLQQKRVIPAPQAYAQTAQPTPLTDQGQQQDDTSARQQTPQQGMPQYGMQAPQQAARGGKAEANTVPILAAGGEFIVSPEHVARFGGGDVEKGHRWFDKFVVEKRGEIIQTMKNLKPPVKS